MSSEAMVETEGKYGDIEVLAFSGEAEMKSLCYIRVASRGRKVIKT